MRAVFVATPLVGFLACSPFSSDPSATHEAPDAGIGAQRPDASSSASSSSGSSGEGGAGSRADLYAQAVIDDGPIAYWRCRDADPSGVRSEVGSRGLAATFGTAGPKQVAGGLFEGGGECDFGGDFASFGTAPIPYLGGGDYTLEVWLKPTADPDKDNYRHVFEHTDGTTGRAYGMFLHRFDGEAFDALGVEEFTPSPNMHRSITVTMPLKDEWHHIVVTKGPSLFVDGMPVGNVETNNDYVTFARPFLWGSKSVDADRSIVGAVTEIAVYQKVLPLDRILIHYAYGKP